MKNIRASSHIPVLVRVLQVCCGPVLELGMGLFSTPLLHWICEDKSLKLYSYDNDPKYKVINQDFASEHHKIYLVENWDEIDIQKKWGLVFIDHKPGERRAIDAIRVANYADYVVVHDTDENISVYDYGRMYPYFKYRRTFKQFTPNTSIFSNFIDLENLWLI